MAERRRVRRPAPRRRDDSSGAPGFPAFEHNQWTVEGEIERFGSFGSAVAKARGWRRVVGVAITVAILTSFFVSVVALVDMFR
jgi:hypothetical protein